MAEIDRQAVQRVVLRRLAGRAPPRRRPPPDHLAVSEGRQKGQRAARLLAVDDHAGRIHVVRRRRLPPAADRPRPLRRASSGPNPPTWAPPGSSRTGRRAASSGPGAPATRNRRRRAAIPPRRRARPPRSASGTYAQTSLGNSGTFSGIAPTCGDPPRPRLAHLLWPAAVPRAADPRASWASVTFSFRTASARRTSISDLRRPARRAELQRKFDAALDRLARQRNDDVAGGDAGRGRGTVGIHVADGRRPFRSPVRMGRMPRKPCWNGSSLAANSNWHSIRCWPRSTVTRIVSPA